MPRRRSRLRARRGCRCCRAAALLRNAARPWPKHSSSIAANYLDRVIAVDVEGRRARVEPGVVLDRLNRQLRQQRLFFPVDPSTASRATIGGMTANNSCGSRSLRYGNRVHSVRGVESRDDGCLR
jgi:FAD/FMN-containing dehydrogenase